MVPHVTPVLPFPSLRLLWQVVLTLQHPMWTKHRPGKRDLLYLTMTLPPIMCNLGQVTSPSEPHLHL